METYGFFVADTLYKPLCSKLQRVFNEKKLKIELHKYAYLISEDSYQEGYFCEICSPSQMIMQKAASILQQVAGKEFELSIPLDFAASPSTGCINKAVHAEIDVLNLPDMSNHFNNIQSALTQLRKYTGIKSSLVFYARQKDFKLLGFSPAQPGICIDAWQKYLGNGLRAHNYRPRFSNCWTTSPAIYSQILASAHKQKA